MAEIESFASKICPSLLYSVEGPDFVTATCDAITRPSLAPRR